MPSKSNQNCCVVNCHNTYANAPAGTKFYKFPSRSWEKKLKSKWVKAVNSKTKYGLDWQPTRQSLICSVHFVGNNKSQHPQHPAYLLTIFPDIYKRKRTSETSVERFHGAKRRALQPIQLTPNNVDQMEWNQMEVSEESDQFQTHNFLTMDRAVEVNKGKISNDFVFVCLSDGRNVEVQANIPNCSQVCGCLRRVTKDFSTQTENETEKEKCQGFHGVESIEDDTVDTFDEALSDLAGVNRQVFAILLAYVADIGHPKLSKENRLLLFLMRMKHNLSYSALGVLFGVHRTTSSLTFRNILASLSKNLKDAIIWPSKEAIQETMPPAFKVHYPRTRVIIDCTEIRTEQPKRVDTGNYMYYSYKSGYTVKFLIGIAPNGLITFKLDCYGGRSSDAFITNDSGFLKLLEPGDTVLTNKGFPGIKCVDDTLVVMCPRVHDGVLSVEEVEETYNIATVRIHVERCMQRVKNFLILKFLQIPLLPYVDEIVAVACAIVNLQLTIIKKRINLAIN